MNDTTQLPHTHLEDICILWQSRHGRLGTHAFHPSSNSLVEYAIDAVVDGVHVVIELVAG